MARNTTKMIQGFLNYSSSIKGLTKQTIDSYNYDLKLFFRFLLAYKEDDLTIINKVDISIIDNKFLKEIEIEDIYAYLSYLENERRNINTTRAKKVATLKSYFKYLYSRKKLIDIDLASELETPKTQSKMPIYMTENEAKELLSSVKGRNAERDKCILIIFLNTGIRLSELCGIDIDHIKDRTLVVTGKGNKQRNIYLNDMCMGAVYEYTVKYRDIKLKDNILQKALFISERKQRINKRTVEYIMQRTISGSSLSKEYSIHKLRHTAATMLYNSGADIRSLQTILGHTSVATTQIYTHINDEKIKNIMELNPLNNSK